MAKMDVKLTDNSKEVLTEFEEKMKLALSVIGNTAEGYAKRDCPVDTGRLRNSISNKVVDKDVYIGTNVEYAPAVEYRNVAHKTGKAHFLKNAASNHGKEYRDFVEAVMKNS